MITTIHPDMAVLTGKFSVLCTLTLVPRSLLVVNRGIRIGFHYDSLNHRNDEVAKETLGKIGILLNERQTAFGFPN